MVKVKTSGISGAHINRFVARKQALLRSAIAEGCHAGAAEGQRLLLSPDAHGRRYRSRRDAGHRPPRVAYPNAFGKHFHEEGEWHIASAPYQPPHEDTGQTRKAIGVFLEANVGEHPIGAFGWIGPEALWVRSLNDGAANRLPRPIMDRMREVAIATVLLRLRIGGSLLDVTATTIYEGEEWGYAY